MPSPRIAAALLAMALATGCRGIANRVPKVCSTAQPSAVTAEPSAVKAEPSAVTAEPSAVTARPTAQTVAAESPATKPPLKQVAYTDQPGDAPAELKLPTLVLADASSAAPSPTPEATAQPKPLAESASGPESVPTPLPLPQPEAGLPAGAPELAQVVDSVRQNFPLVQQAEAQRTIAAGEALSAAGAFDRKVDGFNNWQPQDFYENHWYTWKLQRNTMWGGKVGAGYKLGRGTFEPWYKERETNDGGELSISVIAPIGRDRWIDANRAELWRAQLERGRVEPFIQAQVINAVRDGKFAYWAWVAASANLAIAENVLQLALDRTALLERQVELGEKAEIELVDNQRIILSRSAKLADAKRKQQETAIKLSLFLRTVDGRPLLVEEGLAPKAFPKIDAATLRTLEADLGRAMAARPELVELTIIRQQLGIALRQAQNETRVDVDAGLFLGQDVGNPTSSDDKSEFEVEGTLMVSVPLERRKARGKIRQVRGKIAAVQAKRRFAADKIGAEVRAARAALEAAALRVEQTTESVALARRIVDAEQKLYNAGQSTLFNLNLREKQAADAAVEQISAEFDYFTAQAKLDAALGIDGLTEP